MRCCMTDHRRIYLKITAVLLLTLCLIIPFASCGSAPDDFQFFIEWGTNGAAAYYSDSGTLRKDTYAEDGNADKFITELTLDKETLDHFYKLLNGIDLKSYPEEYDPGCGFSAPSWDLNIGYTANGKTYKVSCKNVCGNGRSSDEPKGQAFLDVFYEIKDYLVSTPEWKALPDYERHLD